jgi:integrase/recombinase XerD
MSCKEVWVDSQRERIGQPNQKAAADFDASEKRSGSSNHTRYIYLKALELLDRSMKGKPFHEATGKDRDTFFDYMAETLKLSDMTRRLYWGKCQVFLGWLFKGKPPSWVREKSIKARRKTKTSADMLTPGDIEKLLTACINSRDRAIISLLAETGIRRSELIGLKIKHVQFMPEGYALVQVPDPEDAATPDAAAKTGSYTAYAEQSIPHLRHWLNEHPQRHNREAALFVGIGDGRAGKPLESQGLYLIVKRVAKAANVGKPISPHAFRHASATMLAKSGMTAEQINLLQGRRQDSRVAQDYINMDNRSVIEQMKRRRGFSKEQDNAAELKLTAKNCWKCGTANPAANLFCFQCQAPLKGSQRFEEIANALEIYQMIKGIHQDPELRADLERLVQRRRQKQENSVPSSG